MRRVILESPFAPSPTHPTHEHILYAQFAARDCLSQNEAPFASHLLYTYPHILNDEIPEERQLGMEAGWSWMRHATACVVYIDLGISPGMQLGMHKAKDLGIPVIMRRLPAPLHQEFLLAHSEAVAAIDSQNTRM